MAKLMMISADSHAAMNPADYTTWLDPAYRDAAADLVKYTRLIESLTWEAVPDPQSLPAVDSRGALRGGGKEGLWNPARRMAELEAEGFVAEILFPADRSSQSLFFSNLNEPHPRPNIAPPGVRRTTGGCPNTAPTRPDVCWASPRWSPGPTCRPASVKSIGRGKWVSARSDCRALRASSPINRCSPPLLGTHSGGPASRMISAVCVHIGHNVKQGTQLPYLLTANLPVTGAPDPAKDGDIHYDPGRRPLWQLIFSGVFRPFPVTESHIFRASYGMGRADARASRGSIRRDSIRRPRPRSRRSCGPLTIGIAIVPSRDNCALMRWRCGIRLA